jgi:hypothetical protein
MGQESSGKIVFLGRLGIFGREAEAYVVKQDEPAERHPRSSMPLLQEQNWHS